MIAETKQIDQALSVLLTTMLEEEARRPRPAPSHIRATPFDASKPVRKRADMEVDQLLHEPVYLRAARWLFAEQR